jgi:crossover junction endodeoxyribonuclease RuvC
LQRLGLFVARNTFANLHELIVNHPRMARKSARALWTAHLAGGPPSAGRTRSTSRKKKESPLTQSRGSHAIILGIDPSLRGTGLAVIDARCQPPQLLGSITIKIGSSLKAFECLGKIADGVEKMVKQYGATEAAIEETIYVQNFRTAQAMGASRGAALSVLARLGLSVHEYAPKRIKMSVTGHGSAAKEQVGQMIKSVLGLKQILPLDESDAAAVALCHHYSKRD